MVPMILQTFMQLKGPGVIQYCDDEITRFEFMKGKTSVTTEK